MKRKKVLWQIYLAFILLLAPQLVRANLDSLKSQGEIIQICNFNFDNYADTIIGTNLNGLIIPRAIIWGKDTDNLDTSKYSEFLYPNWENLNVARYSLHMNYDTIKDFIFIISGDIKVPDSTNTGDSVYKHQSKKVLLFAQNQLVNQNQIRFEDIDSLQREPYFAMNLEEYKGLNNPGTRDFTNRKSYFLPKFNIKVNDYDATNTSRKIKAEDTAPIKKDFAVTINPNPANTFLKITSQSGIRQIEVANILGEKIISKDFSSGIIDSYELDITGITTGLYIIKVIDTKYGLSQITNIIIEH